MFGVHDRHGLSIKKDVCIGLHALNVLFHPTLSFEILIYGVIGETRLPIFGAKSVNHNPSLALGAFIFITRLTKCVPNY